MCHWLRNITLSTNGMFQTMYELLRYISHVPTLLPHAAMEDTKLGGYTIPKDTQVMKFSSVGFKE